MRSPGLRVAGILSVGLLALLFTGCSSNNTGKIVGKWKMMSGSSSDSEKLKGMGLSMAWDFKSDGTFTTSLVSLDDSKPGLASLADNSQMPSGKYNLSFGDRVNFTNVQNAGGDKRLTTNISINGDNMTMKDPDGTTMQFVRMK